jgi:hypothetical protein
MVSSNEADFNLRETCPLSRNTLHSRGVTTTTDTGQRTNPDACHVQRDYRDWTQLISSPKVEASHLHYLASVRDSAKSGLGCEDNRHLSYLAESIFVNVGDPRQHAKVSSPPMTVVGVGATIVVRDWENQSQGEGSQSVGTSRAKVAKCQQGGISYEYW